MANSRSAKKRIRQSEKRAARNKNKRTRIKTAVKKVRAAEDAETAREAFREATTLLDRAATRRLIHPNKVARMKSQLQRHVNELAGEG